MKVIIAGSRHVTDHELVENAIRESEFEITEVVSGVCRGVDRLGIEWASKHDIPVSRFPANWSEYGKRAGPIRNREMAEYADALILVWDGHSRGSKSMKNCAKREKLRFHEEIVEV